ncbi:Flp pilus assembly protein TadG [Aquamicrobium terrae]
MFRKFFRDTRGNYALLTVVALVPLMGALALAVDYTEISRQRQDTLNALDAAGLATARYIASGVSDSQAIAYANNFFTANLRHVDPVNTVLTVVLPNNSAGGGTLKMCADLTYSPYFLPAAAMLIGREFERFQLHHLLGDPAEEHAGGGAGAG